MWLLLKLRKRLCLTTSIDRNSSVIDRFKDGLSALQFFTALQLHPALLSPVLTHSEKGLTALQLERLFKPDLSPPGSNRTCKESETLGYWADYLLDCEEGQAAVSVEDVFMFATGLTSLPPSGLEPSPKIEFLDDSPFPMANTCSSSCCSTTKKKTLTTATSSTIKCFGCGGEGHLIKACPNRGAPAAGAAATADPSALAVRRAAAVSAAAPGGRPVPAPRRVAGRWAGTAGEKKEKDTGATRRSWADWDKKSALAFWTRAAHNNGMPDCQSVPEGDAEPG
ncbi:G2/M phase-specific E3 ubiquitin-protein ligase [Larimichthys crocea]|uniref:G2/M phase-specific E3 ubiquitin-protein ligase n=1 Tax=Larimichthys crocea TaxID=215358 RepID=A0A6G0HLV8_LARCR|nr:G2/M phase-specific E3 ubiquitin-protein ligase [Larimichthys crocea]